MRQRLPSIRREEEDDRRPVAPSREESLESIVRRLAQTDLERHALLPKVLEQLRAIAEASTANTGQYREKSDSRLELEKELVTLKAGIVDEIVKGESMRAKAMLVRWTGAAVIEGARQLWRARLAAVLLAAAVGAGGYVIRDCQGHWPARASIPATP